MLNNSAPDLINGFVVNAVNEENCWATELQCVLKEEWGSNIDFSYLSHECRIEKVRYSTSNTLNDDNIFDTEYPEEFLTYSKNGAYRQLPCLEGLSTIKKVEPFLSEDKSRFTERSRPNFETEVHCEQRDINFFTFHEILSKMRSRSLPPKNMYLMVQWVSEGAKHTLYCPCRYMNFGNENSSSHYLQPIAGQVLFPISKGQYQRGYVACALNDESEHTIEFVTERLVDPLGWLVNRSKSLPKEMHSAAQNILSLLGVVTARYDNVFKIQGTVQIYSYL